MKPVKPRQFILDRPVVAKGELCLVDVDPGSGRVVVPFGSGFVVLGRDGFVKRVATDIEEVVV